MGLVDVVKAGSTVKVTEIRSAEGGFKFLIAEHLQGTTLRSEQDDETDLPSTTAD